MRRRNGRRRRIAPRLGGRRRASAGHNDEGGGDLTDQTDRSDGSGLHHNSSRRDRRTLGGAGSSLDDAMLVTPQGEWRPWLCRCLGRTTLTRPPPPLPLSSPAVSDPSASSAASAHPSALWPAPARLASGTPLWVARHERMHGRRRLRLLTLWQPQPHAHALPDDLRALASANAALRVRLDPP